METKTRIIAAYIVLVGLPLLSLVGILRAGARLTPVPAVRGNWIVEADFTPWRGLACQAALRNLPQPFWNIAQSGKDLTITFNNSEKTVLFGRIRGSVFRAASTVAGINEGPAAASTNCPDPRSLRLEGSIDNAGKERSLSGTISGGCSECRPLAFHAVQPPPDDKGLR